MLAFLKQCTFLWKYIIWCVYVLTHSYPAPSNINHSISPFAAVRWTTWLRFSHYLGTYFITGKFLVYVYKNIKVVECNLTSFAHTAHHTEQVLLWTETLIVSSLTGTGMTIRLGLLSTFRSHLKSWDCESSSEEEHFIPSLDIRFDFFLT